MKRLVLTFTGIAVSVVFAVGSALAFQCPKLVGQINAAAGNRFDAASIDAKIKADEATKLHAAGKHADAEKAAKEGLNKLGVTM